MKYTSVILILVIFFVAGCIESSPYREISLSDLISDPLAFQNQHVCFSGVIENNTVSEIEISGNYSGTCQTTGTLARICGVYQQGRIEADSIDPLLTISTPRDVYRSNETMNVQVAYFSSRETDAQVTVYGIENTFGQPLLGETRNVRFENGLNVFDFEFTIPSCEECSALEPGDYFINVTITLGSTYFETYKKITLENESILINTVTTEVTNTTVTGTDMPDSESFRTGTENAIMVEYFYDPACQKCAKVSPLINEVIRAHGNEVVFSQYNVKTDEGLELARKYKIPGIPTLVINEKNIIAYGDYDGDMAGLEALLNDAIANPERENGKIQDRIMLSVPSVFAVGFLAGFNPCLLAILAFIASVTLATTGRRRNVLLIVVMFSLGIFVTYLIVGIGLLRIIDQSGSLQSTITRSIIVVITLLGLWHVYDAYHLRKNTESLFYTPRSFIRLTESITRKVSLPAAFLMGALFSLIKAPCVGAVYFVILDMIRSGDNTGMLYLASYNLGVVLPVLIIGGGIAFGLNPEKVDAFRKDKRSAMRLVTGITLIAIAALMYLEII